MMIDKKELTVTDQYKPLVLRMPGKGDIETKQYKNYMVWWLDKDGNDLCKLFRIEQTVSGSNKPDDKKIIEDYMRINYGNSIRYSVKIYYMDETITIDENYQIQT